MTPEQEQEIIRLRALNLAPKQIARQLGLRPAEVNAIVRMQAANLTEARIASGEITHLTRCVANSGAVRTLLRQQKKNWFGKQDEDEDVYTSGFAQVFTARIEGSKYILCSYLIDYYCLGLKDTLGPKKVDRMKYEKMLDVAFGNMGEEPEEITLEQAQAIVFGAIDYAAKLGFKPHADFERSKVNLGERLENLQPIECGRKGKPFYISGPYDNPDKILATLRSTVGEGNFDYMTAMSPSDFF